MKGKKENTKEEEEGKKLFHFKDWKRVVNSLKRELENIF